MLDYLKGRVHLSYVAPLLMLVVANRMTTDPSSRLVILPLVAALLLLFFRSSRLLCYATLAVCAILLVHVYVFEISSGRQDVVSDRDEQLEVATRAFLDGENPWSHRSTTGNQITAGPPAVLLALAPVAIFDRIEVLTFGFYLTFLALLLYGDLRHRNDSFSLLVLLLLSGALGFQHTIFMSLEEYYYWFCVLAIGWILLGRGYVMLAGACLAITVLGRLSYGFPVVGFLFYYWHSEQRSTSGLARLALGGVIGTIVVAAPFFLVSGLDLIRENPWFDATSRFTWGWPETNFLFDLLNRLYEVVGPYGISVMKLALALPALWLATRRLSRLGVRHPFWGIALGALVSNLMVITAQVTVRDYLLFPVLPAMLALAFTERSLGFIPAADARDRDSLDARQGIR